VATGDSQAEDGSAQGGSEEDNRTSNGLALQGDYDMKSLRVSDEAYSALSAWIGRLQTVRRRRVYCSEALLDVCRLADTLSAEEITRLTSEKRTEEEQ